MSSLLHNNAKQEVTTMRKKISQLIVDISSQNKQLAAI